MRNGIGAVKLRRGAMLAVLLVLASATPAQATITAGPSAFPGALRIMRHHGPVQHHPTVYLVFWGRGWQQADPIVQAEENLFRQLPGSSYLGFLGRYGVQGERFGGAYFFPHTDWRRIGYPSLTRIAARAAAHFHVKRLAEAQFVILPGPSFNLSFFATDGGECGEHDYLAHRYVVSLVMPFASRYATDCTYDYSTNNGSREPVDAVAGTTSLSAHEFIETATDPMADGSGWSDETYPNYPVELADPCYFDSGTPPGLGENVSYIWDTRTRSCALPQ